MSAGADVRHERFGFVGVSTSQSAIMRVFPSWAERLSLRGVTMAGFDLAPASAPEEYRAVIGAIRADPAVRGALVTTHKLEVLRACRDMFDYLDPYAELLGEVSSLSKRNGKFCGHAKDPISSQRTLDALLPAGYWRERDTEAVILGGGGSGLAISISLMWGRPAPDRPRRLLIVDRNPKALEELRAVHERAGSEVPIEYRCHETAEQNDHLLAETAEGALVVNATGMGKDLPGSPISDAGRLPRGSVVWELNYRGTLEFLHQAERQREERDLRIEDGWRYFIHGWTCVIEEVFGIEMTPALIGELSALAAAAVPGARATD